MNEIEQLRADIATLDAAKEIFRRGECRSGVLIMEHESKMKQAELAKLEAEEAEKADPWREHKEVLSGRFHTQQGADHDEKLVLNYAIHLQQTNEKLAFKARLDAARIAELEAGMQKMFDYRATYKGHQTKILELQDELAKRPAVWCVRIQGRFQRKQCGCVKTFSDSQRFSSPIPSNRFEPYTGEQS